MRRWIGPICLIAVAIALPALWWAYCGYIQSNNSFRAPMTAGEQLDRPLTIHDPDGDYRISVTYDDHGGAPYCSNRFVDQSPDCSAPAKFQLSLRHGNVVTDLQTDSSNNLGCCHGVGNGHGGVSSISRQLASARLRPRSDYRLTVRGLTDNHWLATIHPRIEVEPEPNEGFAFVSVAVFALSSLLLLAAGCWGIAIAVQIRRKRSPA